MKASECKNCRLWIDEEELCAYYGSSYQNVKPCDMRKEGN